MLVQEFKSHSLKCAEIVLSPSKEMSSPRKKYQNVEVKNGNDENGYMNAVYTML